MIPIKPLAKGPKGIVAKFNEIINALNNLSCTGSSPISVTATSNGWVIATGEPHQKGGTPDSPGTAPAAGGGPSGSVPDPPHKLPYDWRLMNVVVETDTGYTTMQTYVLGTPIQPPLGDDPGSVPNPGP
jgi:hypothetical protein